MTEEEKALLEKLLAKQKEEQNNTSAKVSIPDYSEHFKELRSQLDVINKKILDIETANKKSSEEKEEIKW